MSEACEADVDTTENKRPMKAARLKEAQALNLSVLPRRSLCFLFVTCVKPFLSLSGCERKRQEKKRK